MYLEIDPNAVVLVQVLVPLWCAAAGSTTFEAEMFLLCPWGRPWLLCARGVCRLASPVACSGPAGEHLSLALLLRM